MSKNQPDSKEIRGKFKSELDHLAGGKFPVDALPEPCSRLVKEAEENQNLDPAFTSSAILAVLSTSIGNSRQLNLKNGWFYHGMLFIAMVGGSSTGKSPADRFIFNPLIEHDNTSYKQFEEKLRAKKEWENLSKEEKAEADPPETPIWKRKLLDDHTPESLIRVLNENPKGICLHPKELKAWFQSFQRYNSGPDEQRWLSLWDGDQFDKTRNSENPLNAPNPFCSVFGGIQPAILSHLFNPERASSGFTHRILFATETPDRPPDKWKKTGVSEEAYSAYKELIQELDKLQPGEFDDGNLKRESISFTDEAMDLWEDFYNKSESRIHYLRKNSQDQYAELLGKLQIYTGRLALILALGNDPKTANAKKEDLSNAIRLTQYFETTANKVWEMVEMGGGAPNKKAIIKHCVNHLGSNQSDVARALKVSKEYVSMVIAGKK